MTWLLFFTKPRPLGAWRWGLRCAGFSAISASYSYLYREPIQPVTSVVVLLTGVLLAALSLVGGIIPTAAAALALAGSAAYYAWHYSIYISTSPLWMIVLQAVVVSFYIYGCWTAIQDVRHQIKSF